MKRKSLSKLALLLAVPLALWAVIAERNSWRPKTIELPGVGVGGLTFSPDGRYLLATDVSHAAFSIDIVVCDVTTRKVAGTVEESDSPIFLEQGRSLAVFSSIRESSDRFTSVLSFPSLRLRKQYRSLDTSFKVAWPNDETLANQDIKGNLVLWNARSGATEKISLPLPAPEKGYSYDVEFLPDNKTVMITEVQPESNYSDHPLQFWDVATKKRRFVANNKGLYLPAFTASANGICVKKNKVENGNLDIEHGNVEIWDYFTGQRKRVIEGDFYHEPCLSSDGTVLAIIIGDLEEPPIVSLWDTNTGQHLRDINCRGNGYGDPELTFSPDSRTVAYGNFSAVQLWRVK